MNKKNIVLGLGIAVLLSGCAVMEVEHKVSEEGILQFTHSVKNQLTPDEIPFTQVEEPSEPSEPSDPCDGVFESWSPKITDRSCSDDQGLSTVKGSYRLENDNFKSADGFLLFSLREFQTAEALRNELRSEESDDQEPQKNNGNSRDMKSDLKLDGFLDQLELFASAGVELRYMLDLPGEPVNYTEEPLNLLKLPDEGDIFFVSNVNGKKDQNPFLDYITPENQAKIKVLTEFDEVIKEIETNPPAGKDQEPSERASTAEVIPSKSNNIPPVLPVQTQPNTVKNNILPKTGSENIFGRIADFFSELFTKILAFF